ncbi:hypothetical protein ROLI_034430 [Roseobacter fucihabitans]|uniref:VapC45 PIN like domain-containing protein n=1 Tax=Roseobacter fucihabitans TaxID=1537242 RepID=A0ABZ2BX04_9RHOB|nr:hypothetical protein [Roseobacter litoralis]MBC6966834.1 hypothetical protein [Roseobacter litoralis]
MAQVLLDHNMPPAIARGLHEVISFDGHAAHALRDKFPTNIEDIAYFDKLGSAGNWIVISKDLQNARKKAEKAAILRNRIVAFYLAPALQKMVISQQAAAILWHWDSILQQRKLVERGLFQLPENKGRFRQL